MILILKLKTSLLYNKLRSNWFLIVIGLTLTILCIENLIYLLFLCAYLIYLYRKDRQMMMFFTFLIVLFVVLHGLSVSKKSKFRGDETTIFVEVVQVKHKSYGKEIVALHNKEQLLIQYKGLKEVKSGQQLVINGMLTKPSNARIPGAFDYSLYLKHKGIHYIFQAESIDIKATRFHINLINESVSNYFGHYSKVSSIYLKAFILGDSGDFDIISKESITKLGISHLFAVSGLHISILVTSFKKILCKAHISENKQEDLIIGILIVYMIVSSFLISIIRVVGMEIIKFFNKKWTLGLDSLDGISILFLIMLLINPAIYNQLGFVLSFSVAFMLVLGGKITSNYENNFIQSAITSTLATLGSFLFIMNINNEINVWTILINILFIYLVSFFLLPLTFIVAIFKPLDLFYEPIASLYQVITKFIAQWSFLPIAFPTPTALASILFIIISYIFIRSVETKQKVKSSIYILIIFLILYSNAIIFQIKDNIYFLDLRNGESTVINESFNKCNLIIDTGEGYIKEVSNFLKHKGIKSIDYLILTHSDFDHIGEAIDIINGFNVKNIVINAYDTTASIQQLISTNTKASIHSLKAGDQFYCGSSNFQVISPIVNLNNSNQNSLVIYASVFGKRILFTGDIEEEAEKQIIQSNGRLVFDVLKVAHHGSKSSTTTYFIDNIGFEVAVIMCGNQNKYGFPHSGTIDKLKNHNVYRADHHYTMWISKYFWQKEGVFGFTNI